MIASRIPVDHQRVTVPYSYVRKRATAGNIAEVSSTSEMITGKFAAAGAIRPARHRRRGLPRLPPAIPASWPPLIAPLVLVGSSMPPSARPAGAIRGKLAAMYLMLFLT